MCSCFTSQVVDVSPYYPPSFVIPDSIVFQWINTGDTGALSDWLKNGGDPNLFNGYFTLLGHAVISQQPHIVIQLLDAGADVEGFNISGLSALQLAVSNSDTTLIGLLLDAGADIKNRAFDDFTPLMRAVDNRNPVAVDYLIKRGADFNARCSFFFGSVRRTALHHAAEIDCLPVINILLDAGANIETLDNTDKTPLLTAWKISPDFVKNQKSTDQTYETESMVKWHGKDAFLYLWEQGANISVLRVSPEEILQRGAWFNLPELMKLGLKRGGDVNVRIRNELGKGKGGQLRPEDYLFGRQLIHLAAKFNATKAIEFLKTQGVKLTAPDSSGQTPFIIAVNWEAMDVIELMLSEGISPDNTDLQGIPALQFALRNASYEVADFLLQKGASANKFDLTDPRPLIQAARKNDIRWIELLLKWGFNPNVLDRDEIKSLNPDIYPEPQVFKFKYPIHYAAKFGNEEICRLLINAGAEVDIRDQNGLSTLSIALGEAKGIKHSTIRLLLENGADVNQKLEGGYSPLHLAVKYRDPDLVQMFNDFGADPDQLDGMEKPPMAYCNVDPINAEILLILFENGADFQTLNESGRTLLHCAIVYNHRKLLEAVLAEDAKSIINSLYGNSSALHLAISKRNIEFARLLLQAGADPNVGLNAGESPVGKQHCLSMAYSKNDTGMVKLLLDYGARAFLEDKNLYVKDDADFIRYVLNSRKKRGETPLIREHRAIYLAVAYNAVKCMKTFIMEGVNINIKNDYNQTPLWWAFNYPGRESLHLKNKTEVVELLLSNGADPNQNDDLGLNLLCHAIDNQAEWFVRLLLEAGARANSIQKRKSALHYAVARKNLKLAQMLIEHGAFPDGSIGNQKSPLQMAKDVCDAEMVELLKKAKSNVELKKKPKIEE